jgi:Na+/proline symporter
MDNYIWVSSGIFAVVLLIIFWHRRNAVWGGLTLGAIVGSIIIIFSALRESGFNWYVIGKFAIVGTLLGFIAELLGKLSDSLKKK